MIYYIKLYYIIQYDIILYYTILYFYYIILYYIILYYIKLYYILIQYIIYGKSRDQQVISYGYSLAKWLVGQWRRAIEDLPSPGWGLGWSWIMEGEFLQPFHGDFTKKSGDLTPKKI